MTLVNELERLGRAVAATGAVGDVAVMLPRVAFFRAVREVESAQAQHPRKPIPSEPWPPKPGMQEVVIHCPSGAVRVRLAEDT